MPDDDDNPGAAHSINTKTEVPKYYGDLRSSSEKPNLGIREWITLVDSMMARGGWSEEQTAATAQICMRGEAAIWFQNQMLSKKPFVRTWTELKPELLRRFYDTGTMAEVASIKNQLNQGHFDKGETVRQFYDRCLQAALIFQELQEELPAGLTAANKLKIQDSQLESSTRIAFVAGLRPEIRAMVNMSSSMAPDVLLVEATKAEATYREKSGQKNMFAGNPVPKVTLVDQDEVSTTNTDDSSVSTNSLEEKIDLLVAAVSDMGSRRSTFRGRGRGRGVFRGNRGGQSGPPRCFRCQSTAHLVRSCPEPAPAWRGGGTRRYPVGQQRYPTSGRGGATPAGGTSANYAVNNPNGEEREEENWYDQNVWSN